MTGRARIPPTERRNPRTHYLDRMPTVELVCAIHSEDATVPGAVAAALPQIVAAVDLGVDALSAGGRLHYVGAGTSGRLAVLDAAELPPTYGAAGHRVVAHLAGGPAALLSADPSAEDDPEAAAERMADAVRPGDVVVGVTASGRTPFVGAALRTARARGAWTVLVSNDPQAALAGSADVHVAVDTGPEVVTGSTRMKAATAAKLVLHTLSTAVMVRLGHTYSNLMVDVAGRNDKLDRRRVAVVAEATGAAPEACAEALRQSGWNVRAAVVAILSGPQESVRDAVDGRVGVPADVVAELGRGTTAPDRAAPRAGPGDREPLVVGLDCGGSGTRCVVATVGGRIIGRGEAGGANPWSAAAPHAAIAAALRTALADTDPRRVVRAVAGMAGAGPAGRPAATAALWSAWRDVGLTCPVDLRTDLELAFVSATAHTGGLVLVAGTGAAAAAVRQLRLVRRCDGHGWFLGDDGSAVWLGRAAVRAVLAALDGRAPETALTAAVSGALGITSGDGADLRQTLVARISPSPSAVLASLAPVVATAATSGDEVAAGIAADAADRLLQALATVAPDGPARAPTVVLAGSVLLAPGPVGTAVQRGVRERYGVGPTTADDPALGAARLAAAQVATGG
ncbi:N-acetylmuramic acid 6-phosphate etherase [Micromonospora sp. C95]|uniref:N-acetylmuramic acid 6-phosphate etherase n=1 Tax=Micromonospora sp. C95 TaxID=2824882 RepID=UPI001B390CF1|nr:N-acetylmuramic acid 6-phosphate etherase [Micromonospora sp. C95]MBQ1026031.1 N-acetylmuramic acid 6-phosphate etherase [Micromonospora sp. C95]